MNRAAFWIASCSLLFAFAGCGHGNFGSTQPDEGAGGVGKVHTSVNQIVPGRYSFVEIIQEFASASESGVLPTVNQLEAKNQVFCAPLACEINRRSE